MSTDATIPVAPLIIIEGRLKGVTVHVLKDDGCNTNVISKEFFAAHPNLFETRELPVVVSHSKKGTTEISNTIIPNATLEMGSHQIGWLQSAAMTSCLECHGTFRITQPSITKNRRWPSLTAYYLSRSHSIQRPVSAELE